MTITRNPAVAGMFYPADRVELHRTVQQFLKQAPRTSLRPKAIIAPHAGYIYSGPIAASAYACLESLRDVIHRVILLGPAHRVPFHGLAVPRATVFATPLGAVSLDQAAIDEICRLPQVRIYDEAHQLEHSLEVHLPFLQEVLDDFTIVPLVVGDAQASEVAEVLEILWGGLETLIVVSSDLSHYHDYDTAREMDQRTSHAIEQLQPEKIQFDQACGRIPVNGLLTVAKRHGLHAQTVDMRNSGDTAGPRDQVVGYGAYIFDPEPEQRLHS